MSIAITAPEKFDFQDLVCIELMLRFEAKAGLIMLVEPEGGEDAGLTLPRHQMAPLVVEVQVKGASGAVTMADIAACLAHCPPHQATGTFFERLLGCPDSVAILVMSGRCDDATSALVMPFTWDGASTLAGRIKTGTATAFLGELASIPAASSTDLATRRKAHRDTLVSTTTADQARTALDRVLVFERVGQTELKIACDRHLMSKFRIPRDRISDVVNRLHGDIKQAKRDKADVIPQMRATLAQSAPASMRPQGYVLRGIEANLVQTLSAKNCLLLSGPPRCGKTEAARWVAAEFEQLGYDIQQGADLEAASRFLLEPVNSDRLFILDDPLGGAHLHPNAGRILERLGILISKLSLQRKLIVAQSQDAIFDTLARTQLQACSVGGRSWIDLAGYSPDFLSRLWTDMATAANAPASLTDQLASALKSSQIVLEPGCLQHLASSRDRLSDNMSLDQAVRIAREPAKDLGRALVTDQPSMASLLIAVAIGSTPSAPIAAREVAFAMDGAPTSLPGKATYPLPGMRLGGAPLAKETPTYDEIPALDDKVELDLEKLERRGIVNVVAAAIEFAHPYYRAAGESILEAPTSRIAAEALGIAERALFCLEPATSRAVARNLNWLFAAMSNRPDAQHKLISICVDGFHSIFPATRDLCFTFLVRHLAELSDELKRELPGWVRTVARASLDDVRWENGEAVFPSEGTIDGSEWFLRSMRQVNEADVSAEIKALESDGASYLSSERAAEVLAYFKHSPGAVTARIMGRLLSYDEAILRAEAARLWLSVNRADDAVLLSRIFDDESPIVALRSFSGACSGWSSFSSDRQAAVVDGLKRVAKDPFVALILLDRLVVFHRVEEFGDNPAWPIFGALMPIVLEVLPPDANISEPRLYSVMEEASDKLPVDAVIPILTSWTSWLEHELARGVLADEYALAVSAITLDITGTDADLRREIVRRLFALPGTSASMAIIRDFVDSWPNLGAKERADVINMITSDRLDRKWLQALVLTRRVVPPDLQEIVLGDSAALSADASSIIRDTPSQLLNAAVAVYCGRPQPLWWIGTHHTRDTIWETVIRDIAHRPEHPQFETALADIMLQQKGEDVAEIVKSVGPEHLQRLFDILLRQRINENGNYLSEAWEALFEQMKDETTRKQWLDRFVEAAPVMLDDLDEIDRWLTGEIEKKLFDRLKADVVPLLLLHELKDLPPDGLQAMKEETIVALKALLTKAPPQLFGTYDRISRECKAIGLENIELDALLREGRDKIFRDRDKQRDEERHDPLLEGWIDP